MRDSLMRESLRRDSLRQDPLAGPARELDLSGGTIRYRSAGTGPTIVFVHGVLVDGRLWDGVAGRLAEDHHVVVPDWPLGSHERPMRADAALGIHDVAAMIGELLERLELRDVTLVGNDSGGALCQVAVTRDASRIARLVLTPCDALEVFPPFPYQYLAWLPRIPGAAALALGAMHAVPAIAHLPGVYGSLSRHRLDDALLRSWVRPGAKDPAIRRDFAKLAATVHPSVTLEAARRLPGFPGPVLFAWSRNRFFPPALAERLAGTLPRARVELLDGGVFLPLDAPAEVAASIARFVAEDAAQAAPARRASGA